MTEQINSFVSDYAILTVGAINAEKGIMYHNHEDASIGNAVRHQAKTSIVLTDHSKFG
ncbi:MAG: hypothetical protein GY786_12785 [Proteobacteria bacterium]|nr:hypothetical protein [Pseudomonadota bacterium]